MNLLITRPYIDSIESKQLIESKTNHKVFVNPLLEIEILQQKLFFNSNENIIITSANGVEALAKNSNDKNYNLYLIGNASIRKAESLGYKNLFYSKESIKNSNTENLFKYIKSKYKSGKKFYHITSVDRKRLMQQSLENSGYGYEAIELYNTTKKTLSNENLKLLRQGFFDGVILYSERTARVFLDCIKNLNLTSYLKDIKIFCLSTSIYVVFNEYKSLRLYSPEQINTYDLIAILGE